jgi:hypothetical protein
VRGKQEKERRAPRQPRPFGSLETAMEGGVFITLLPHPFILM